MTSPSDVAIRSVLVVVPARDEEDRVAACVRSVLAAASVAEEELGASTWVVVAADSCTDRTLERATQALGARGQAIAGNWGQVGTARGAGVVAGLRHLGDAAEHVWIANTDADCQVPERWIVDQLDHADRGADAVLGIVDVDNFDEHPAEVEDRFRRRYVLHGDGSHEHVHGANLGVRARLYHAAGGWPDVALSEDHALVHALTDAGAALVRTIHVSVVTSGRRLGRARGGFADLLVDLGASA